MSKSDLEMVPLSKSRDIDERVNMAQSLFINTDMTLAQIGKIVGLAPNTLTKYKKLHKWSLLKTAKRVQGPAIAQRLYAQLDKILDLADTGDDGNGRPLSSKEADAINKLCRSISELEGGISISHRIQAFEDFARWMEDHRPEMLKEFFEMYHNYLGTLSNGG